LAVFWVFGSAFLVAFFVVTVAFLDAMATKLTEFRTLSRNSPVCAGTEVPRCSSSGYANLLNPAPQQMDTDAKPLRNTLRGTVRSDGILTSTATW
jgi:hypothetical protein